MYKSLENTQSTFCPLSLGYRPLLKGGGALTALRTQPRPGVLKEAA